MAYRTDITDLYLADGANFVIPLVENLDAIFLSGQTLDVVSSPTFTLDGIGATHNKNWSEWDGSDNLIVPHDSDLESISISIEAWIYLRATTGTEYIAARYNGTSTFSTGSFEFRIDNQILTGRRFSGGNSVQLTAPDPIPLNTWTHVAYTYTAGSMCLYINGVQVATSTPSGNMNSGGTTPLWVGNRNGGQGWSGGLAYVAYYPGIVLTPTEIQSHYNQMYVVGGPGIHAGLGELTAIVEVSPTTNTAIDAELGGLGTTLSISTPAAQPHLLSVLGGLDAGIDTDVTVRVGIDTELGELAATVNTNLADQCIFDIPLGGLDSGLSIDLLTTHPEFTAALGGLSASSHLRSIITDLELAAALGELHAGVTTAISIDWPAWGRFIPTLYTRTYVSENGQIRVETSFLRFRYVPERDSLASITTPLQPVRVQSTYSPVRVREG